MDFANFDVWGTVLRLGLGVVIGFCIGLTGVGGGVLGLQAMTLVLGLDPIKAVGTTSLYIFLTNISASFQHAKLKNIAWGAVARILGGAVPANILVALWISRQGGDDAFKHSLKTFIICIVFFSIGVMIINTMKKVASEERSLAAKIQGHWMLRNVLCILLGAVIGGLIGATSVGGGVLIVPLLIIIFGLSASRTVGSSIFIAMVLTFVTALIYGKGGELDYHSAVVMAIGSLAGVRYGSKLSVKLPDTLLRWIMIGLILLAAIMMLLHL
ncbi:MAG: sulfite exporter TauE/SafE family protein [Kiritimatiellales bacterium]|nr:sulfite exporter TauE/SafE family protein [Kiritimatiellales bacterium]